MTRKLIAGIVMLLWVAWWAYDYFSAPVPDTGMVQIFALFMGLVIPIWLALAVVVAIWIKRSVRRH